MTDVFIPVTYLYTMLLFYSFYLLLIEAAAVQTKKQDRQRGLPGLLAFGLLIITVLLFAGSVAVFGG